MNELDNEMKAAGTAPEKTLSDSKLSLKANDDSGTGGSGPHGPETDANGNPISGGKIPVVPPKQ